LLGDHQPGGGLGGAAAAVLRSLACVPAPPFLPWTGEDQEAVAEPPLTSGAGAGESGAGVSAARQSAGEGAIEVKRVGLAGSSPGSSKLKSAVPSCGPASGSAAGSLARTHGSDGEWSAAGIGGSVSEL